MFTGYNGHFNSFVLIRSLYGRLVNQPFTKSAFGNSAPYKSRPWANQPPVENVCSWKLFIDLQKAFDWVDKDISSGEKQKIKGSFFKRN